MRRKQNEKESDLRQFTKTFRGRQQQIECLISDLPENVHEILGTLFNIVDNFLCQSNMTKLEIHETTHNCTKDKDSEWELSPEDMVSDDDEGDIVVTDLHDKTMTVNVVMPNNTVETKNEFTGDETGKGGLIKKKYESKH